MPITSGNIAFQVLSLVLLGLFCWIVYNFRAQMVECLKSVIKLHGRDEGGVENKQMYDRFLGAAAFIGALAAGLGVAKFIAATLTAGTGGPGSIQWIVADMAGTTGIAGVAVWLVPAMAIAVSLIAVLIALTSMGALKAAGGLTLSGKFTDEVIRTKKNWLAACSVFLVPLVLVWSGANPTRDTIIGYLFVILAFSLCGLFVATTFRAFMGQKVSVLIWFLYLCAIEIFPVGVVVLAVTGNL
jgi:hypothetical protein